MNHEKAIKQMDELFRENSYTEQEERFVKATALSILAQIRVAEKAQSEYVDHLLGHTFGSVLQMLAFDLSDESKQKVQDAVEFFIHQINGATNEH